MSLSHRDASLSLSTKGTAQTVDTILQLSSSPSARPLDPSDFCYDDLEGHDTNQLIDQVKQSALRNIYLAPNTPAPPGIAEALADKAIFGFFKYQPDGTRQKRDVYNSVSYADLQDSCPLIPLSDHSSSDERFKRALVEATTTYFRIIRDVNPLNHYVLPAIEKNENHFSSRPLQASAYVMELVSFIFDSVSGDHLNRMDIVAKLVAGVPVGFNKSGFCKIGFYDPDSDIARMYGQLLPSLMMRTLESEGETIYSSPLLRWKASLLAKTGFAVLHPQQRDIIKVTSKAVLIDHTHNIIERGLALGHPVLGSAIVGPFSATATILSAMTGCNQTREARDNAGIGGLAWPLIDADRGIKVVIAGIEVKEESMVSMLEGGYYTTKMLANFIDESMVISNKLLIFKEGIILYFPLCIGPWYDKVWDVDKSGRDPMKLVFRVPVEARTAEIIRDAISAKSQRLCEDWLEESPVSPETKKRFQYIMNKPGRALVKRHGIRGSYGRLIAAGLLICGVIVGERNFAGRDNWLERLFDGAQAASLLAAVVIVLTFFLTHTLTNSLDLLAGVTEAQDIDHMLSLTSLSIEELQGVLTYARGTLYWLSEYGASYCRAVRLGTIVMTHPLSVSRNAETKNSFFASEQNEKGECIAGWIAQSRVTRVESSGSGDGRFRVGENLQQIELAFAARRSYFGEIE